MELLLGRQGLGRAIMGVIRKRQAGSGAQLCKILDWVCLSVAFSNPAGAVEVAIVACIGRSGIACVLGMLRRHLHLSTKRNTKI